MINNGVYFNEICFFFSRDPELKVTGGKEESVLKL